MIIIRDDGKILASDGKNKVNLNLGNEEATIQIMKEKIEDSKLHKNSEANVNNSYFTLRDCKFRCEYAEEADELFITLDCMIFDLITPGNSQETPGKTFYLVLDLGNKRIQNLKQQVKDRNKEIEKAHEIRQTEEKARIQQGKEM